MYVRDFCDCGSSVIPQVVSRCHLQDTENVMKPNLNYLQREMGVSWFGSRCFCNQAILVTAKMWLSCTVLI